ncbi:unnamed protein product [Eruca vesicaria subsp. sativa]|uniref:PWWP domain-containing protein n=1 Tax=Eruca vesicaria subsp. sativa TaxID=29727 RepID=A0ABC8M4W4_ERUVS|nr:unnamed protein product [Eruca vesicaria subsp. sativa]
MQRFFLAGFTSFHSFSLRRDSILVTADELPGRSIHDRRRTCYFIENGRLLRSVSGSDVEETYIESVILSVVRNIESGRGMGSSGSGVVDWTVGSIVWVRRRNGSWWPGRILG